MHFNSASGEAQESLIQAISEVVPEVIDVALFQANLGSFDEVKKLHKEVVEGLGTGIDVSDSCLTLLKLPGGTFYADEIITRSCSTMPAQRAISATSPTYLTSQSRHSKAHGA